MFSQVCLPLLSKGTTGLLVSLALLVQGQRAKTAPTKVAKKGCQAQTQGRGVDCFPATQGLTQSTCDFVNLQAYSSGPLTSKQVGSGRHCAKKQISSAQSQGMATAPQMGKKRLPCARISI